MSSDALPFFPPTKVREQQRLVLKGKPVLNTTEVDRRLGDLKLACGPVTTDGGMHR